ncbi:MerR family transcriptional regulator [Nonomuraea sp. FMUSA5-5]|uniref:MerR family transcriptional regulator n=1 Tax=Nonomuraea composti TaxID=2720023 RepID=A0ABX1BA73_9ACTN|nr:MerR family transcriptional regulator [Nonomuraea sp. FMUSA5-5]NJP94451.1 MerR family transcriptional regulator [Nonomuraea sp. FMUSA5-5]
MRISELSAKSGVAIPTIKYYLREGMLHQGEQTAATRAEYDETHLRRLRLIRALLDVGRLSVASIKKIVAAVEDESMPVHQMLGTAHWALSPAVEPEPGEEWQAARAEVDAFVKDLGWDVHPDAPTRDELAQTLIRMRQLGVPVDLAPYVEVVRKLVSEVEMRAIPFDGPRDAAVEALVLGTVLYGRALDTLRRMAQESESARRMSSPPGQTSDA